MGTARMLAQFARLTANCYRSRPAILGQRDARFRECLRHAFDESPYYREQFREAGIGRGDLETVPVDALPTLSPGTLDAEFDRIVTDPAVSITDLRAFLRDTDDRHERYRGEYVALRSSGSEGDPTPFLYGPREWDHVVAADMRTMVAAIGLRSVATTALDGRVAYIAGVDGNFMGIVGLEETASRLNTDLDAFPPNIGLSELADRLAARDVTQLVGYPSTLVAVADLVAEGACRLAPAVVLSAGEPLPADTRRYLTETFDAPVVNLYAATECGAIGVGPPDVPGMYLFDDTVLVEPRADHTLVTSLFGRTVPLIRFELPDVLVPQLRPADARLPFSYVQSVVGRAEDLLRFPDGLLFSTALNEVSAPGATRFQFRKRAPDTLEVRYQCQPTADPATVRHRVRDAVESVLAGRGLKTVTVAVTETDLDYDPHTGKTPLVVRDTATSAYRRL